MLHMIYLGVTFGQRTQPNPSVQSWRSESRAANAITSSALENAVYDMNRNRKYRGERVQETRTAAIFYWKKDRLFCAMDDSPRPMQNLLLSLSYLSKADLENRFGNGYVLPKKNARAIAAVERAEKDKRVFEVDNYFKQGEVNLPFAEFERIPFAHAVFGQFARPYCRFLEDKKYRGVRIEMLSPERVAELDIKSGYLVDRVDLEGFRGYYELRFDNTERLFVSKCVLDVQGARSFEEYNKILAKKS